MPAAAQPAPARQGGDHSFGRTAGFQGPIGIREPYNRISVSNVNVFRVRTERIERNPERLFQVGGKDFNGLRLSATVDAAQHLDHTWPALGKKDITVRSSSDQSRVLQAGSILFDLKAGRSLGPRVGGLWNELWAVVD